MTDGSCWKMEAELNEDKNSGLPEDPDIAEVMKDPAASQWLKSALGNALSRDPVDAVNDAEVLYLLLDRRCRGLLGRD